MTRRWAPNYSQAEVRALIEGYTELRERKATSKFGLQLLVSLADLDRAMNRLPKEQHDVVLLHGLLRLRGVETHLGVDRATVWRRYAKAIGVLTDYLNNGG